MSDANKKIIWAVDPICGEKELQLHTLRTLSRFSKGSDATIEPVCVLGADQTKIPSNVFSMLNERKEYRLEAEETLRRWTTGLAMTNLDTPRLLKSGLYAGEDSVSTLLRYAKESGAALIGVSTHARKAMERFLFGSFAESLLMKSDVPLLVVNPHTEGSNELRSVLFPTDFSDASLVAFKALLESSFAKSVKVTLFHKLEYFTPYTAGVIVALPEYNAFAEADTKAKHETAKRWEELAKTHGVKVECVISNEGNFVEEAIFSEIKKRNPDMIALASNSGRVASAMLGSIARKVVRNAPCPVWVIHSSHFAAEKKGKEKKIVRG